MTFLKYENFPTRNSKIYLIYVEELEIEKVFYEKSKSDLVVNYFNDVDFTEENAHPESDEENFFFINAKAETHDYFIYRTFIQLNCVMGSKIQEVGGSVVIG